MLYFGICILDSLFRRSGQNLCVKNRRRPVKGFNSVDAARGYALRFGRAKSGYWFAITVTSGMSVLGGGDTIGECGKSIADGIRYTIEFAEEDGLSLPEPEGHSVPFSY